MAGLAGGGGGGDGRPGQGFDAGVKLGLVGLDHGDVVGFLRGHQPVQVGPHGVQRVEGDDRAGQVQRREQVGEVAGLVVLDVDFDLVEEPAGVLGHAEQVDPGAVRAASAAAGLAVQGHSRQPGPRRHRGHGLGPPGPPHPHGGRRQAVTGGARRRCPGRSRPEQRPAQRLRVQAVQHDPDRLLIRCPVPAGDRIPRRPQPGQIGLGGALDPLSHRGEPVMPGGGQCAQRHRDQTRQRVDPSLRRTRVRQRLQPRPPLGRHTRPVHARLDHARTRTRQCHRGHATPRS